MWKVHLQHTMTCDADVLLPALLQASQWTQMQVFIASLPHHLPLLLDFYEYHQCTHAKRLPRTTHWVSKPWHRTEWADKRCPGIQAFSYVSPPPVLLLIKLSSALGDEGGRTVPCDLILLVLRSLVLHSYKTRSSLGPLVQSCFPSQTYFTKWLQEQGGWGNARWNGHINRQIGSLCWYIMLFYLFGLAHSIYPAFTSVPNN